NALSPGPGADGQVLKMTNGALAWGNITSGGGVTSVATGTGLTGGPITTSGTISINSTVVPLLNANQTFSGTNTFNGPTTLGNANNVVAGNGSGLTGLNAGNVSSGTLADGRLSANVPLLNGNQTFSASNTFNGVASMTNANNRVSGTISGNGSGL